MSAKGDPHSGGGDNLQERTCPLCGAKTRSIGSHLRRSCEVTA